MSTVSTDPIADMLTRIRNAVNVQKREVMVPHSKVKQAIAELLVKNNYLKKVDVHELGVGKMLKLTINSEHENSNITEISRMSTPGRRWYVSADEIPKVKQGRGIVVLSTSKGMMTGRDAKQQRLGGELICKVY